MTDPARALKKYVLGNNPVIIEGFEPNLPCGSVVYLATDVDARLTAVRRETWLAAANYHNSQGCPAIADDEGDMVLADYGQCCCDQDELRAYYRQQAEVGELET